MKPKATKRKQKQPVCWPEPGATPPSWHQTHQPGSMADMNGGAFDLCVNLRLLLDCVAYLRCAKKGITPVPVPDWWDGTNANTRKKEHWATPTSEGRVSFLVNTIEDRIDALTESYPGGPLWDRCVRLMFLSESLANEMRKLKGHIADTGGLWAFSSIETLEAFSDAISILIDALAGNQPAESTLHSLSLSRTRLSGADRGRQHSRHHA